MVVVAKEQLKELEMLNAKKSKVIIFVKWRYPFYTKLENFQKTDDCALIGVFAEEIRSQLFDGYEHHFDQIIWFHADYTNIDNAYSDYGQVEVPILDQIISQIVEKVSNEKIRLLESEEVLIDVLCRIRAEHSIPGAKPGDLNYLRDKAQLKQACKRLNIPTARFVILDFKQNKLIDELIKEVEHEIGVYPMFRKPIRGFGSGGSGDIKNTDELKKWLIEMSGQEAVFLIEECINKLEFWTTTVLLPNGSWKAMFNLNCGHKTTNERLDAGLPIPFIGERIEDCAEEFPDLLEFVSDVIKKLKPMHPHIFCVQGFQLEPKTNKYLFTECGYRLNGARGSSISYRCSGISQETAFISSYMDPNYVPKADPTPFTNSIWYPYQIGTLKSHKELPGDSPVKSRLQFKWLVPVGTKLFKAESYNHFVVSVMIEHEDASVVKKDLEYLLNNWRPEIC
ncbi:hypothetical protein M3Y97_00614300 [Aphelenchoides bicaudatus]|nr:hypothetical protein M3Y97_00614300 [Aphelenchoides bicaudatus]